MVNVEAKTVANLFVHFLEWLKFARHRSGV